MAILTKETLITAASLGAGAVAAKVVQAKVLPMIPVGVVQTNENVQNLITLGLGIVTPMAIKSNVGKGLGAGMIAASVAGLVSPYLKSANLIAGTDTFLGADEPAPASSNVLMGSSDAPSYDFTAGDAGEMDF